MYADVISRYDSEGKNSISLILYINPNNDLRFRSEIRELGWKMYAEDSTFKINDTNEISSIIEKISIRDILRYNVQKYENNLKIDENFHIVSGKVPLLKDEYNIIF